MDPGLLRTEVFPTHPFEGSNGHWRHEVRAGAFHWGQKVAGLLAWLIIEDKFDSLTQHFFSAADDVDLSLGYLVHLVLWAEGRHDGQFPNCGRIGLIDRRRIRKTLNEGHIKARGLPWLPGYVKPRLYKPKEGTADDYKVPQKSTWVLLFRELEMDEPYASGSNGIEWALVRQALEHVLSLASAETPPRRLLAAVELGQLLTKGYPVNALDTERFFRQIGFQKFETGFESRGYSN